MHFEDLEVNECIVNSSELAGHGCQSLTAIIRTPSVTKLFGEKGLVHTVFFCTVSSPARRHMFSKRGPVFLAHTREKQQN